MTSKAMFVINLVASYFRENPRGLLLSFTLSCTILTGPLKAEKRSWWLLFLSFIVNWVIKLVQISSSAIFNCFLFVCTCRWIIDDRIRYRWNEYLSKVC